MTVEVYGTCAVKRKRKRRTQAELSRLEDELLKIFASDRPMTVRQVFYRAVSAGIVDKTERDYNTSISDRLVLMRRSGKLPYHWIADNSRWMRKPRTFSSLDAALENCARTYRRALWDNQDVYVEVWVEKDALAGILALETNPYDIPLMVSKGFASESYLYEAAEAIKRAGKPTEIYYFGDHDPSGVHIDRCIERGLRRLAPDAAINFRRVAVLSEQIAAWSLPTRPTKKEDKRSKNFVGESVEVDAIPSRQLRQLVKECIERHVDQEALKVTRIAEESERDILRRLKSVYAEALDLYEIEEAETRRRLFGDHQEQ